MIYDVSNLPEWLDSDAVLGHTQKPSEFRQLTYYSNLLAGHWPPAMATYDQIIIDYFTVL